MKSPDELDVSLATVLNEIANDGDIDPSKGILHHKEGVDLMPANIELSALEMSLVNAMSRETILRSYINQVKQNYDYILIDCMPSLGILTINALTAADSVLIPVQTHYLSAKGMSQLLQTIQRVQKNTNPKLKIEGVLLTMFDKRTNLSKDISGAIRYEFGKKIKVFPLEIPMTVRVTETGMEGESIYKLDKNSKAAAAYEALTREVLGNEQTKPRNSSAFVR